MNLRKALSVALIIFAIAMSFYLFVKPIIFKQEKAILVQSKELHPFISAPTNGEEPVLFYVRFREEAKEWAEIVKDLSPILTLILAWFLKHKKKEN